MELESTERCTSLEYVRMFPEGTIKEKRRPDDESETRCCGGKLWFFDSLSSYTAADRVSYIVSASPSFAGQAPEIWPVSTDTFSFHLIS